MPNDGPVAIVSGSGTLPVHVSRALDRAGRDVILAEMEGFPTSNPDDRPVIPFRVERLGALFRALRQHGVREVVFAGAVARPRMEAAKFDVKTLTLAPKILSALRRGDDGLLRTVLEVFEAEGFSIRAAHDLAPELLLPAGSPTRAKPGNRDRKDAARAARVVAALAAADIGQGAVVAQGVVLAVESAPGTDAMLDWVAGCAGRSRPDPDGAGGVLFKGPKPGQDRRVDLPVIGNSTVTGASRAGLAGIVVEAGGVMVIDAPAVIEACDAAGLFLWVREPGERS